MTMPHTHSRTNLASCVVATIFLFFIIILLLILYFTLFKPHHPHISVTSLTLPSYSLSNATLNFTFSQFASIQNPNRDVFSHYDSSLRLFYAATQVAFMFIPAGHIDAGRTLHISATFTVNSFPVSPPPMLDPTVAVMAVEMETRMEMAGRVRVLHLFTHHVMVKADCRVAVSVTDGSVLGLGSDKGQDLTRPMQTPSWKHDATDTYIVKSAYRLFSQQIEPGVEDQKILNLIWNSIAPLKTLSPSWRIMMEKLPCKLNLIQRGVHFHDVNVSCIWCHIQDESVNHMFFSCDFSYSIWQSIYLWLGFESILPANGKEHLLQHSLLVKDRKLKNILSVIWMAAVWILWTNRNAVIFNNMAVTKEEIVESIKLKSWIWIKGSAIWPICPGMNGTVIKFYACNVTVTDQKE